jgi:hypothetical protein
VTPPSIQDAKDLATLNRAKGVLVLQTGDGKFAMSSYGHTRAACRAMGDILDQIDDLIKSGVIEIPSELQ